VSDTLDTGSVRALDLDAPAVLERVARIGDPYAENLTIEQELPALA
jgi:hypothetical protein